jgi:tRNA dimethylallyltransferase
VESIISTTDASRELIFVGGTGLYFEALTNGFAEIPEISPAIVEAVQQDLHGLSESERMALLRREDPETAERLKVADPQRAIRALAVKRQTGRALSSFQGQQGRGPIADWTMERMVVSVERDVLRERISRRFTVMFSTGAVEEVEALLAQELDPTLPAMKAIGVPEIAAWLSGRSTREEAIEKATIATHQYAKRQRTWLRNRMGDWPRVSPEAH